MNHYLKSENVQFKMGDPFSLRESVFKPIDCLNSVNKIISLILLLIEYFIWF